MAWTNPPTTPPPAPAMSFSGNSSSSGNAPSSILGTRRFTRTEARDEGFVHDPDCQQGHRRHTAAPGITPTAEKKKRTLLRQETQVQSNQ